MTEEIKQSIESETPADLEALNKIRTKKKGAPKIIGRSLFPDLEKKFFDPLREKYYQKYPDINWNLIESFDELPKDCAEELEKTTKEFLRIIQEKDDQEILVRAKDTYEFYKRQNMFEDAYSIAKLFLDQTKIKEAAREKLKKTIEEMKKGQRRKQI